MNQDVQDVMGTWQALTGVLAGSNLPEQTVSSTKLTLSETEYVVDLAGTLDRGTCTIEPHEDMIRIKIVGTDGPNEGKTYLAILERLGRDEIRIAYDLSGSSFPRSFEPTAASSSYVASFART